MKDKLKKRKKRVNRKLHNCELRHSIFEIFDPIWTPLPVRPVLLKDIYKK